MFSEVTVKRVQRLLRRRAIFITVHRRHVYFVAFVVMLAVTYAIAAPRSKPVQSVVRNEERVAKIAIDAGHGGPDPGAIGVAGTREKDVTLAIALKLEQTLRAAGLQTLMTRTTDDDLVQERSVPHRQRADLIARAALVNAGGADLFISLHANSFPSPSLAGAQTFHLDDDDDGWRLAVHIQNALVRELGPNQRRAAPAELRILSDVNVPSAVVEVGFLSNSEEEALLNDPAYQGRVAQAVANGVLAYLNEQRRRQQSPVQPARPVP